MNKYVLKINGLYDRLLSAAIARNERKKLYRFINNHKEWFTDKPKGSAEWKEKWSVLGSTDEVFYRWYSNFIGEDLNILPDDLMHNVIEPILNPMRSRGLYADKNMFDKLLKPYFTEFITPKTIFRCINGGLYDKDYYLIEEQKAFSILNEFDLTFVVAKPTVDSSSGHNILFYDNDNGCFLNRKTKEKLSIESLKKTLGDNFIVQEGLVQSAEMSQFNPTSINTLRVSTYKSVTSEKPIFLNGDLRIGKKGSETDNVHSGGCRVGINPDGSLKKVCSDQLGNRFDRFNGIDFGQQDFVIPNYENVKLFAQNVSACLPHQRILALDIMLDCNNQPKLVEYNNYAFTVSAFQMTVGTVFGDYTDEVIDYCKAHLKEATRIYLTY